MLQTTGATVATSISPAGQPDLIYPTFTTKELDLAEHASPGSALHNPYTHIVGLPVPHLVKVQPSLPLGSDYPYSVTPIEPLMWPVSHKSLGWTVKVPTHPFTLHHYPVRVSDHLS